MRGTIVAAVVLSFAVSLLPTTEAKEREVKLRMKRFETPAAKVYAAVVQVASEYYELMSATKEGYSVVFPDHQFGEDKSWVVTAVCHEDGENSVVTLYFKREESIRLAGVEKLKDKMAEKFWARLERVLKLNEHLVPSKSRE